MFFLLWCATGHRYFTGKKIADEVRATRATLPALSKPVLRCSSKLSVLQLRKFVAMKLELAATDIVEILCEAETMGSEHNLRFIRKTRWFDASRDMVLHYRLRL